MSMSNSNDIFATTHWSVVLRARNADTPRAAAALTDLCQTYWFPLYAYVRSRGHSPHDAEDLTQGFFANLLRLESLAEVSPEKGKFRAFLLAALKNHVAKERRHDVAQKRDARRTISLDAEAAESRYALEPIDATTPERFFERQWALTLLETVMNNLQAEYEAAGRGELFRQLRFAIIGEKNATPYRDLAEQLGMSEPAIRVAVHRLRQAYKRVLHEEIAHTVSDPADVAEELRELRRALAA